ncbi:MAG TPA: sigma-54 dependent transcriptional regulator [Kofleriaceae bacterium]|nr:sigma-54 dependent transcriptional regulator [Kofleriaceae bacterium]
MNGTILIVDDDDDTAVLLRDSLRKRGYDVDAVNSAQQCLERLRTDPADVVVTDVQMSGMSGIDLCVELRQRYPDLLPLVLTGQGGLDTAIAAIRAGAYDFITKPVKVDALAIAVQRAVEHLSLQREVQRLRRDAKADQAIDGIAGGSPAIRETIEMIRRVSDSDATVLVTGESGTGKELVARALHRLSPRAAEPFVAVNCAAMPAPLLESELFGHVRGAFTDAKRSRAGLFVQAGAGTIFLDEIGEMPIEMQVKLLRVLQERKVRPVGGDEEVPFEARVVTATNRDLETEVEEKRFREDLFYRINVVAIPVPPLRARAGDILLLAQYFLKRIAARTSKPVQGISGPAARLLMDYDWPGNVRELENSMERAVALCRLDEITVDDLPSKVQEHQSSKIVITTESPGELITLDEMERRYVRQVLNAVGGNKTHAARILGIDRRSLYRRLEEPRHDPKASEPPPSAHARTPVPVPPPHASNGHGAASSAPGAAAGQPGEVE